MSSPQQIAYRQESLKLYGFFPEGGVYWADTEEIEEAKMKGVEYSSPLPNHYYRGMGILPVPSYEVCIRMNVWMDAIAVEKKKVEDDKEDVIDRLFRIQGTIE